jgi:hypothetical protein
MKNVEESGAIPLGRDFLEFPNTPACTPLARTQSYAMPTWKGKEISFSWFGYILLLTTTMEEWNRHHGWNQLSSTVPS